MLCVVPDFLESGEGWWGNYGMSRLVGVSLADLFLFAPPVTPPSPTQRLDCTT